MWPWVEGRVEAVMLDLVGHVSLSSKVPWHVLRARGLQRPRAPH